MKEPDLTTGLTEREFERLVNADLRDKESSEAGGPILRDRANLVRWLKVLTSIRISILSQNANDNAWLKSHPERPAAGFHASRAYLQAKQQQEERRQTRERVLRVVGDRIGEAQRLIGVEQISTATVGGLVHHLVKVDALLRDGSTDEARRLLAAALRNLTDAP